MFSRQGGRAFTHVDEWRPVSATALAALFLIGCAADEPDGRTRLRPQAGTGLQLAAAGSGGTGPKPQLGPLVDNPDAHEAACAASRRRVAARRRCRFGPVRSGQVLRSKGPDGDCGSERVDPTWRQSSYLATCSDSLLSLGSMDAEWNGTPKYQAAGDAIIAAITPLRRCSPSAVCLPERRHVRLRMSFGDPLHWIPGARIVLPQRSRQLVRGHRHHQPDQ